MSTGDFDVDTDECATLERFLYLFLINVNLLNAASHKHVDLKNIKILNFKMYNLVLARATQNLSEEPRSGHRSSEKPVDRLRRVSCAHRRQRSVSHSLRVLLTNIVEETFLLLFQSVSCDSPGPSEPRTIIFRPFTGYEIEPYRACRLL